MRGRVVALSATGSFAGQFASPLLLGPAIAISLGTGLLNTPLTTTVTSGVHRRDAGAASGLMNTTKQVGGALGLAALVTIATATPAGTGDTTPPAHLTAGYAHAFLTMAALMLAVALLALTLPTTRTRADQRQNELQ